ncbi:MAG TPA: LytTR family DNA-binding domain-containing protein [Dysgonamonadaceae bacterium]|nr:LytTR family DNA-binding domain-containing protein [Dysgonamonadaceae bacterium]
MKLFKRIAQSIFLFFLISCGQKTPVIDLTELHSLGDHNDIYKVNNVDNELIEVYIVDDSLHLDRHKKALRQKDKPNYVYSIQFGENLVTDYRIKEFFNNDNIIVEHSMRKGANFFSAIVWSISMTLFYILIIFGLFYLFLRLTIKVVLNHYKPKWIFDQFDELMNKYNNKNINIKDLIETFPVRSGDRIILVSMDKIIDFTVTNNFLFLTDFDNNEYLIDCSLKDLESKLPTNFVRIHRNTIINKSYIKEIKKLEDGRYDLIIMMDKKDKKMTCSKNYNDNIKDLLKI